MIHFKRRTLYIRNILTHDEYTELSKRNLLDTL
jgi:mRNA-degrading endonuclease HigB of HigAB toxin-antitoxin module